MSQPVRVSLPAGETELADAPLPLPCWLPDRPFEVEIGFGKGRYLLGRAAAEPERGFVGIESAAEYYGLARDRAHRMGLGNVIALCGEAVYLLTTCLARGRADAVHVYFPDPWPKSRHHRRRLLTPVNLDVVVGLLRPQGRLYFASDHAEYGAAATELLMTHPGLAVEVLDSGWPEGPRTNYEIKYEVEGRAIRRLVATRIAGAGLDLRHPLAERLEL